MGHRETEIGLASQPEQWRMDLSDEPKLSAGGRARLPQGWLGGSVPAACETRTRIQGHDF